ncbi:MULTISPECIES: type I secretion system permease/ATPase [unclassified Thioalkalivibrio]|uniref:type I secretion system permease/ATPase n=1 Tax=unclassified Thioalkalivibrio TaxID=2621013 RepID=UPI000366820C|nr:MULTISPECIES: type I secretion system permease/ATPase [unclassified Thioalkalivibrio]
MKGTARDAGASATAQGLEEWLEALLHVARYYECPFSEEHARSLVAWAGDAEPDASQLAALARQMGLELAESPDRRVLDRLDAWKLPLLVELEGGDVGVVDGITHDSSAWQVAWAGEGDVRSALVTEALQAEVRRVFVVRPLRNQADSRIDEYIKPYRQDWFRGIVFRDLRPYGHVFVASLLANVLALAGLVFAMQVYDRVIPAESFPTLYVLFGGVVLALLFEFAMRVARLRIIDVLGKDADVRISDRVFGHALRIRNSERPRSTGSFIAQLRELERVRDFMTSTTVSVLADMPFFLLFLVVFWYIAGSLVLVPALALVALVLPGLLLQGRLSRLANEAMREASRRNGMLVESIQGGDDIKTLQAEPRFQNQWNHYNAVTTEVNLRQRLLTNSLTAWGQTVQTGSFAVVILFGAPMVMSGDLTTGALVAASILASRMLVPMAQINQVLNRWQQARVALKGLDGVMRRSVDYPEGERRVHRSLLRGHYQLERTKLIYSREDPRPALTIGRLEIQPGERVAVIGRSGAGKSTLLQGLAGLLDAAEGEVMLDGVHLAHLDPADVRRDVGLVSQSARLFHGSLRENLTLGAPGATDDEILRVLGRIGARDLLKRVPDGLDYMVSEGGAGLSGGQRQAIVLARVLLRRPSVLLLDEPTTGMDDRAEAAVIGDLAHLPPGNTLVVASHRRNVLNLVDRVIVIDAGRVVADDERDRVLAKLRQGNDVAARDEAQG